MLIGVGAVAAQHLRVLADPDTLPLHDLDVRQPADNLVLDLERDDHGELGSFLDREGLVLQRSLAAGGRQVDSDGWTARRLQRERLDDAGARVVGVGQVLAAAQPEGLLVALE